MSKEVVIHMTDFSGHFYTCKLGISEGFGDAEFDQWISDIIGNECGMLPYDGGRINVRACSRVWYEVREVR